MPIDYSRARAYLKAFNLKKLFLEELGWDSLTTPLHIQIEGTTLTLNPVANKRGLVVYICPPFSDGSFPQYSQRRKIETLVRKLVHEHLLIFIDAQQTRQVWQWVRREPGRPLACREYEYLQGQSGDQILQRLDAVIFTLDEEEKLSITEITGRVQAAFDVERVTRRFYDRFQKEHDFFQKMVQGIPDSNLERWYVSVTLNRLMFVYFIQKKGFLASDQDYLLNKLLESKLRVQDGFYRNFLCPLFFDGFAVPEGERSPEIRRLLGDVPYLNGGIFNRHQIETAYGREIQIPNSAFERLFAFFDEYRWHLDERPLHDDREINPDVLGYIFEKYINQREMGAYYTKEDITGYISKSTILPYVLDQARQGCPAAFEGRQSLWHLLQDDPDRYIYPAVRKGCQLKLPPEIEAGIADVSARGGWNRAAAEEYALPTEIWREVVARRQRCAEVRGKLSTGDVREVNDLITYNLDIIQFAQDVVESCETPELLRVFWKALTEIKVLDPTCGSGAFLFAALNILEPLYEACLERMRLFVQELDQSAEKHRPEKFSDFRAVLEQVDQHVNPRYFILKSIILNNLYGVDIMEEAVEICKLRLFLKLAAQVEPPQKIEPLPDIDFNIRPGNTLVGFTSLDEVRNAMMNEGAQFRLLFPEEEAQLKRIDEEAGLADLAFQRFHSRQLDHGSATLQDKINLRQRMERLNAELDRALAKTYGVDPDSLAFAPWRESHKPFHWLVDFYGIMHSGGFDIVLGNPPYIEYSNVRRTYELKGYETLSTGNLYAYVIERSYTLCEKSGFISMIVQLPIVCTDRMIPLQKLCIEKSHCLWFSNFDDRPGRLFDGLEHIRATIYISSLRKRTNQEYIFSTTYNRWLSEQRLTLFNLINYIDITTSLLSGSIPKIGSDLSIKIFQKIIDFSSLNHLIHKRGFPVYFHNAPQYWIRAMNFAPYFWNERDGEQISTQVKSIYFIKEQDALSTIALLNSSLFYWWFIILSDCRHLNLREIENFPVGLEKMSTRIKVELSLVTKALMISFQKNSRRKNAYYRTTGKVVYDEFYPRISKSIIDEIDNILATHYGFTTEELDFIKNYDIKYRLGADEEE